MSPSQLTSSKRRYFILSRLVHLGTLCGGAVCHRCDSSTSPMPSHTKRRARPARCNLSLVCAPRSHEFRLSNVTRRTRWYLSIQSSIVPSKAREDRLSIPNARADIDKSISVAAPHALHVRGGGCTCWCDLITFCGSFEARALASKCKAVVALYLSPPTPSSCPAREADLLVRGLRFGNSAIVAGKHSSEIIHLSRRI